MSLRVLRGIGGWTTAAAAAVVLSLATPGAGGRIALAAPSPPVNPTVDASSCAVPAPPDYYTFEMVTTKNVPGTARLKGVAEVTFAPSPFGISVGPDGSYAYDVHLALENLPSAPPGGAWAVWFTRSDLSEISYAGVLEPGTRFTGRVAWNKFLAIVTLEEPAALAVDGGPARWRGPVVTRGMSRSGRMHTMAGHGPLQQENCAAWGYGG